MNDDQVVDNIYSEPPSQLELQDVSNSGRSISKDQDEQVYLVIMFLDHQVAVFKMMIMMMSVKEKKQGSMG